MKIVCILLILMGVVLPAYGHQTSDSFLFVSKVEQSEGSTESLSWKGEWRIPLDALDTLLGAELNLDQDGDDQITWGELSIKQATLSETVFSNLAITFNDQACSVKKTNFQLDQLNTGLYLYLPFSIQCNGQMGKIKRASEQKLKINYQLFFSQDPQHRGLLSYSLSSASTNSLNSSAHHNTREKQVSSFVFSPDSPSVYLDNSHSDIRSAKIESFTQFVKEGVWHIWIGFDHILFLFALLAPAIFVYDGKHRQIQKRFKPMLKDVLKVVTGFTIAHSITLTLASFKVLTMPSAVVESLIAFSVVSSGLFMFSAKFHRKRWQVATIFGLVHGFGFASVLADLKLPMEGFFINLLAFNMGVEIGQLAIVSLALPLMYLLRQQWVYVKVAVPTMAFLMVSIGTAWILERSLGWQIV